MSQDTDFGLAKAYNVTIIPDEGLWNLAQAPSQLKELGEKNGKDHQGNINVNFSLEETLRNANISRSAPLHPQVPKTQTVQSSRLHPEVLDEQEWIDLTHRDEIIPKTSAQTHVRVFGPITVEERSNTREPPSSTAIDNSQRLYEIATKDEMMYINSFERAYARCIGCGSPDHFFATCPDRQCSHCNMRDHWTKHCPKQPGGNLNQPLPTAKKQIVQERADRFAPGACDNCGERGHRELWCPHNAPETSDSDSFPDFTTKKMSLKQDTSQSGLMNGRSRDAGPNEVRNSTKPSPVDYVLGLEEAIAKADHSYYY